MTKITTTRRLFLGTSGAALLGLAAGALPQIALAQDLKGGTLRVALTADIANFDPQQLSSVNFHVMKNLYDSLIEYTPEGEAIPNLASGWEIAADNTSVTVMLKDGIKFQSGADFDTASLDASLKKGADPATGKNLFPTMSIVENWEAVDALTFKINFKGPVPDKQITDLLQFILPIEASGVATAETVPAGTGPFLLDSRQVGQSMTLKKNPNYWQPGFPILDEIVFTIFSDDASASAALESGAVDVIYNGQSRSAVRLRDAGYQVFQGPGKLVEVFRINSTRAPFDNKSFRQAFNYLMNRDAILRLGYSGLGEVVALPWSPSNPAYDASYAETYAFNPDKAKELLAASGLSAADMQAWTLLVNGGNEAAVVISQIVQATLQEVGINIELEVKSGSEFTDSMLGGHFTAMFGGVGNTQKFPSRIATNSIYRVSGNPVLGDPNPHTAYVEALQRVDSSFGEDVAPAYAHLNEVLVDEAFAIPTNTMETGLIVASAAVGGVSLDIDNLFIGRTIGFK